MQEPLDFTELPEQEMLERSNSLLKEMSNRRTVRHFSDRGVPAEIIQNAIKVAATAPNGANKQPWHFVAVSDKSIQRQIREAAEREEHEFYHGRAPQSWLDDLEVFETNEEKPFLETAPYLIAVFAEKHSSSQDGEVAKNYYVAESVGIATGFLLASLHLSGLATLTHTPSPMQFLTSILGRPSNERPYVLIVVGYPAEDATVPKIEKKSFDSICTWMRGNPSS